MITDLELEELPTCREILYAQLCADEGCSRIRGHAGAHWLVPWPDPLEVATDG